MLLRPLPRGPCKGLALLALLALLAPAGAWYKHVASPRYHTVGRASGLLMGVRRSPYLWRRQMDEWAPPAPPARSAPRRLRLQLLLRERARGARGQPPPPPPPDLASAGPPRTRAALGAPSRRGGGSAGPRQRPAWDAPCPPACQGEAPWRGRPAAGAPRDLPPPRATRKQGRPASILEPEI